MGKLYSHAGKHDNEKLSAQRLGTRTISHLFFAVIGVVAMMVGGFVPAGVATAADASQDFLTVSKTVDGAKEKDLEPGQSFTYQLQLNCSEQNCVNATVTDPLPAALQGFTITGVEMTPQSVGGVASWTEGGTGISQPKTVGADTSVTVAMNQAFSGGKGLAVGTTFHVNITLQVPNDFSPDNANNGRTISNTATSKADNSSQASDSADIKVTATQNLAASISKAWTPATNTFDEGAASAITLKSTNTSNATVDTLTVQEPQTAADNAAQLDANNPFRIVDFTDFGTATMPAGATGVKVDAYVLKDGVWQWVSGATGTSYALPDGVAASAVGGLRFTYTGAMAPGAADAVTLNVAQRGNDRNTGSDLSSASQTIKNVAQAQTAKADDKSPVATANANYTVNPANISTSATKSITPNRVSAGETSTSTIKAANTGSAVKTMTVSDTSGFFDANTTFTTFTAGIAYPSGATSGVVVYHLLAGGTQTVPFNDGDTPAAPSAAISGFDITFSAPGNTIAPNANTSISFGVQTSEAVIADGSTQTTLKNTATSKVTAANGVSATKESDANLAVVKPGITVTVDKTVKPADNVQPGQSAVAAFKTQSTATSDYVKTKQIVVEDSWGSAKSATGFWNAFNLSTIQPTQVPANASLTVMVQKSDGSWITLDTAAAKSTSFVYQLNAADLADKLPDGVTVDSLTGIRFTFDAVNGSNFPTATAVMPYVGFVARSQLRDGSGVTDPTDGDTASSPQSSTKYTNNVDVAANDGGKLSGTDTDSAQTGVISYPGGLGTGPATKASKAWDRDSVSAQTEDTATSHLGWRVNEGLSQVQLSDPQSGADTPESTVFNAFNLKSISPVSVSAETYSNGWYLKYDTVQSIELYVNGAWQTVSAPGGAWQDNAGSFKGYTLTAAEQANATGVRITVVPNDAARTTALNSAADPYAPAPGSGVAESSGNRNFDLVWQLRDKTRSTGAFITADTDLNAGKGVVNNTLLVEGTVTATGATVKDGSNDTINIVNQLPSVGVSKTADHSNVVVPVTSSVDAADYPTNAYTLTAWNSSVSPASYLRVTDPTVCDDAHLGDCATENTAAAAVANPFVSNADVQSGQLDTDPGTPNPFNRQNITNIAISAPASDNIDATASVVWLLKYAAGNGGVGTYSYVESNITAVNAMTAEDLKDVVGVSVTFQSTNPGTDGGTILQDNAAHDNAVKVKISTIVRTTLRTTGAVFDPSTAATQSSKNRVYAQSYDPVTATADSKAGDVDSASVNYAEGSLDVATSKTITPGLITNVNPKAEQTVTLGANSGASTVAPTTVTLSDEADGDEGSTNFWTSFDLTALKSITFPAGADNVVISVYGPFGSNGALAWKDGSAQTKQSDASAYVLPVDSSQYSDIQGLKFTFTKTDGTLFSISSPSWNAGAVFTAVLRDTLRGGTDKVTFPGSATNKITAQSHSGAVSSKVATTTADATWNSGTAVLDIDKLANDGDRSASIGSIVPWDITIKNAGTGYLDLADVVDTLPAALVYTGQGSAADPAKAVQFTAGTMSDGSAGLLTAAPTVDSSAAGKLTFTWPEGQARMKPGETAVIRVWLELQPGPQAGDKVTNTVTVHTKQTLDGVGDAREGNGAGAISRDGTDGAKTSDYISPTSGENLVVSKGVIGSLPGAVNTTDQTQACTTTLSGADGKSYYRTPCAANSTVNGTDQWILHLVNAGTTNIKSAQFFEQLPVNGDQYLVAGNSRGSAYRPQMLDDLKVWGAPSGTTQKIEVTTDANACAGTWSTVASAGTACGANTWTVANASTDWSKVTGLRVSLDFTTSTVGSLTPGTATDVTYSSKNQAKSSSDASGASVDAPATDEFAWNQFGMLYTGASGSKTIAPNRVGVHLRTGSLEVVKKVSGKAAEQYAADSIDATVTCTIPSGDDSDSTAVTFKGADSLKITLKKQEDGSYQSQRVSGIPVGATCKVAEDGETGSYGETTRLNSPTTVSIEAADDYALTTNTMNTSVQESGDPTNTVSEGQIATITNDYQYSGLSVTKKIDSLVDKGELGPFDFTLTCRTTGEKTVSFGQADSVAFTLKAGETWSAPENTIPANSICMLEESDPAGAESTAFTGENVLQTGDTTARITVASDPATVVSSVVTNHYDGGTLTVTKKVDGAGAAKYGTGEFTFHASCTYAGKTGDQQLLDESFTLAAGGSKVFGVYPSGTQCTVKETKSAGASTSALDPEGGVVTIAKQETQGVPSNVTVTATNTYDVGSITIVKKRTGAGAETRGKGPFEAQVTCTYLSDGEQAKITLPNGGKVTLSQANGYRATVDDLLLGAQCKIAETKDGGADSTSMDPADGTLVVSDQTSKNVVTITNVFNAKPTKAGGDDGNILSKTGAAVTWLVVAAAFCLAVGAGIMITLKTRRGHDDEDGAAHQA